MIRERWMKYNVYDFDGTIYDGDSTFDFYKFCIKKFPKGLISLPKACMYYIIYKLKKCSKTRFKEVFYSYLKYVPNIEENVVMFWQYHEGKIKGWYLDHHRNSDIIISASPQFLLEPVCSHLGIAVLIASRVDRYTGKTEGENCWGVEKVRRLKELLPNLEIEEFYSDSLSDSPLAELAQKAYLVRENNLVEWVDNRYECKDNKADAI